jgi:hypothetical protein
MLLTLYSLPPIRTVEEHLVLDLQPNTLHSMRHNAIQHHYNNHDTTNGHTLSFSPVSEVEGV